ncbi:MAG: DUF1648 domain-containing protein [Anaerorhabdus sp.]|jgi:uncharacterized membrane protein
MMSNVKWKTLIITSLLCLAPILIGAYYYSELPEMVAIHFNFKGEPDSYMQKNYFVFLLPILMALLQVYLCYKNDVVNNGLKTPKVEYIFKSVIPLTSIIVYLLSMGITMGIQLDLRRIMLVFLGILFILIGNYMPKTSGYYRTKVMLNGNLTGLGFIKNYYNMDPDLRKRHYTVFGYILFIIGIIYLFSIFLNEVFTMYILIGTILIVLIYTVLIYFQMSKKA